MRRSISALFLLAALGGCGGGKDDAQDIREVDQQLAGDNLIDNDLTAIDAITGADANMAADVDPSTLTNASEVEGKANAATPRRTASRPETGTRQDEPNDEPADAPDPAPAANSSESN